jgi:hypothetical protein
MTTVHMVTNVMHTSNNLVLHTRAVHNTRRRTLSTNAARNAFAGDVVDLPQGKWVMACGWWVGLDGCVRLAVGVPGSVNVWDLGVEMTQDQPTIRAANKFG